MRYRYFVYFRHDISVLVIFSNGIAVLGTPQFPPPVIQSFGVCLQIKLSGYIKA